MTVPSGLDADRALERAHDDTAYEAALRDAYRGRHDVLDALWWAAHPLTHSPRGVPDPATGLRDLKRAAYARASNPAEASESQRKLHEAQSQLAEDSRLLADAIAAAGQDSAPPPSGTQQEEPETEPAAP